MINRNKSAAVLGFVSSFVIVALGQPARAGWLGALAAIFGFALFFNSLPPALSPYRRFLMGTVWFAAVQLVQLSWMTSIEFQGYYILFVYACLCIGVGCQFGLLTMLVPGEGKIPLAKILVSAALWTLMEWTRLFFICGFSWNPSGLALTHFTHAMQFASVFGVFGLTFWVMLTNLIALTVWRQKFPLVKVLGFAALAAVPYLFGTQHFNRHLAESGKTNKRFNVALVQTDLLPSEKLPQQGRAEEFVSPFVQWERIIKKLKVNRGAKWDMIVLPEAAVPLQSDMTLYPLERVKQMLAAEFGPEIESSFPPFAFPYAEERLVNGQIMICVSNLFWCQSLSNYFKAELVAGLDHVDKEAEKNFNSAFYLKPDNGPMQRYDKQVLLPLAEYLPFDFLKPLTKSYGIVDFFTHGKESKVFGAKVPFSASICYEETFPEVMREGRSKGAELFVNVTNDNYYPDSSLHRQHLFHARLRAVENGIPLVRSCNAGISAAIDSFGRVAGAENSLVNSCGVLSCSLSSYTYPTLYTFWGDGGIVSICLIICLSAWRFHIFKEE